jgi:hypothetical protein
MAIILACDNCGYERSSDEDGQQFIEVCGICYEERCSHKMKPVDICNECHTINQEIISINLD